jgi:hypothetical protein
MVEQPRSLAMLLAIAPSTRAAQAARRNNALGRACSGARKRGRAVGWYASRGMTPACYHRHRRSTIASWRVVLQRNGLVWIKGDIASSPFARRRKMAAINRESNGWMTVMGDWNDSWCIERCHSRRARRVNKHQNTAHNASLRLNGTRICCAAFHIMAQHNSLRRCHSRALGV